MANDQFFINQPDYITHSPTAEPSVSRDAHTQHTPTPQQSAPVTQEVPAAQQEMPYAPAQTTANRPQSQPHVSYAQGNSATGQHNYAEDLPDDYFVGRSYSFGDKPMQKEEASVAGVLKIIGTIVFVLFFLGVASRVISGFGEVSNNFSPFFDDDGFLPGHTVYFEEGDFPEGVELPEGAVIIENGTLPEGVEYLDEYSQYEGFDDEDFDEEEDPFNNIGVFDGTDPFGGGF